MLPSHKSLFLFGPRNTGKSTLIDQLFDQRYTLNIDLLDIEEEMRFSLNPNDLYQMVLALPEKITHVTIDEIQKVPKLLDVVHRLMSKTDKYFILTGSSARKLKQGGGNLLAGRAFVYHFFPLTSFECGDSFNLNDVLRWGTLPEIYQCETELKKQKFLNAYTHTYLKEEIWGEQLVRQLDPFRRFLEVAAQSNGKVVNFSKLARDVGVDSKTIVSYYSILEDTLIGFFLDPFHNSFRKRLSSRPKFYFFDTGVVRSLSRLLQVPLAPQTNAYGNAFEHFVILECIRLSEYYNKDFRFTHLRTQNDVEIDLVVERPGEALLCIEIKSSKQIFPEDISSFRKLTLEMPNCKAVCFSQDKYPKKIDHVYVLPWQEGLRQFFTS